MLEEAKKPLSLHPSIPAYDAWLSLKYNFTKVQLNENGTFIESPDQRIFSTDSDYLKITIKLSNIGTANAYNTNFTISLGDGTKLNVSMIDPTIQITNTSNNYTLDTKRKIIVGEPNTKNIYASFVAYKRRNLLDSVTRSFINGVSASIDLTETTGQSQVSQFIDTPLVLSFNAGLRELLEVTGTISGNLTNLKIQVDAKLTPAPTNVNEIKYVYSKRMLNPSCISQTECNKLGKYWTKLADMTDSTSYKDTVFPQDFNTSQLNWASVNYMVETYKSGVLIASNTWDYEIAPEVNILKKLFPLWAIITIAVLVFATGAAIILIIIRIKKARKKQKMTPSIDANSPDKNQIIVTPVNPEVSETGSLKKSDDMQSNSKFNEKEVTLGESTINVLQISNNERILSPPASISIPISTHPMMETVPIQMNKPEIKLPPRQYTYKYDEKDTTDTALGLEICEYIREHSGLAIGLKKIKNGVYMFGRMKINIVIVNDRVLGKVIT